MRRWAATIWMASPVYLQTDPYLRSRYVKDFEELCLQPPGFNSCAVVSKVRHRVDFNIYAVKRIPVSAICMQIIDSWSFIENSQIALQWPRVPIVESKVKLATPLTNNDMSATSADEFRRDADTLIRSTSEFVQSEFHTFSAWLYKTVVVEISKLSRLHHSCIGRLFQGWLQRGSPTGCRAVKQAVLSGTLISQTNSQTNSQNGCSFRLYIAAPPMEPVLTGRIFCIQMEFCSLPTLRSWIDKGMLGPREPRRVWGLFRQVRSSSVYFLFDY